MGQEFKAPSSRLNEIKSEFDSYTNSLQEGYDNAESVNQSIIDEYLGYGWYKIILKYDKIMEKKDSIYDWVVNYIENLKTLEGKLPDNPGFNYKSYSNKKNSIVRSSVEKPTLSSYKKDNRDGEIKDETYTDTTSSSSSSSSSGGYSGGYSGVYPGGYPGVTTNSKSNDDNSDTSKSNYLKAQEKVRDYIRRQREQAQIKSNYKKAQERMQATARYQREKAQAESNYKKALERAANSKVSNYKKDDGGGSPSKSQTTDSYEQNKQNATPSQRSQPNYYTQPSVQTPKTPTYQENKSKATPSQRSHPNYYLH